MFIKAGITYHHQDELERDEIWLEILVERGNSFLIEVMYCRPTPVSFPNKLKHLQKNFEQKLANILSNILLLNKETIVFGDLNCNFLTAKTMHRLKIFSNYAAINKS